MTQAELFGASRAENLMGLSMRSAQVVSNDPTTDAARQCAPGPTSFRARLAALFRAHPNQWLDGRRLAEVGGCYAWRTRVSECRRQLGMDIENRERWSENGEYRVSEYRWRPHD
jgi:hypothetical protein